MSAWLGARGGGVGVDETTGVWDLLGGAGDAAALSMVTASPVLGFFMTKAALFFFGGIVKLLGAFGAGLFAERLATAAIFSAGVGACCLPMLDAGRSVWDIAEDVRDIGDACC